MCVILPELLDNRQKMFSDHSVENLDLILLFIVLIKVNPDLSSFSLIELLEPVSACNKKCVNLSLDAKMKHVWFAFKDAQLW